MNNRSKTGVRSKLFQVSNSSSKCYFMENKLVQWSETRKNHVILVFDQNIRFSVCKLDKSNKNRIFLFNLRGLGSQIQLRIYKQCDLQYCIKYIGAYGIGYGLQAITEEFEKIGQGNFAAVYKLVSTFNSVKAMKMFEKKKLESQKNKLSFQNQINIMREMKSPYLVNLDCIFETDKKFYLQMEFFEETLKSFLKRTLTRKKQKLIMKNLLEALQEMKDNKIVHRDIKPDNIMVRRNGTKYQEFVIIDFGLATKLNRSQNIHKKCGTPGFIAPQIANMTDKIFITQKCDMFSIGVTFFYILTKKKPFSASDPRQMLQKNKKLIIEEHLFYYLSEKQSDLVKRMMERDPERRISVEEALEHPYFEEQVDDDDMISEQNCDLDSKLKQIKIMDTSFMSEGVVLLYSLFRYASGSVMTHAKQQVTKCFGETEFRQLQIEEQIEDKDDEVMRNKKYQKQNFEVKNNA